MGFSKINIEKVGNEVEFDVNTFFGIFTISEKSDITKNPRPFRMKSVCYRAVDIPDYIFILNDRDTYDLDHPRCIKVKEFIKAFHNLPIVQKYELHNIKKDKKST